MKNKLEKVILEVQKKYGSEVIGLVKDLKHVKLERISTGSPYLDWCVTGETEIFDYNSGTPLKISDIVKNKIPAKVLSYKKDNKSFGISRAEFGLESVSNWFERPTKQPTIKITTSYGIPISVTPEHKLLTDEGWKPAKELKEGDYLIKPSGSQIKLGSKRIDRLDKTYLRFLGYWLGDGYSDFGKTPCVSSIDKAIIKDLHRIAKSKGYKLSFFKPVSYGFTDKLPAKRNWDGKFMETNKFNLFLKDFGLLGKHREEKHIPQEIFSLKKGYIAEVLLGLFMADGTVSKIRPTVAFHNISEILVKQIHHLLLVSRINSRVCKQGARTNRKPLWILSINGIENLKKFNKFVPLIGSKGERLNRWCQLEESSRSGKQKRFGKEALCEKITKIENNGLQKVYDLTVTNNHNYLGNGYICHNCTGGGWPRGRTVELYGPFSAGKSLCALRTIASAQREGLNCVFIDAERAFSPKFAEKLGVDLSKLVLVREAGGETVFNIIEKLLEGEADLIIVDSVASLVPIFEEEHPIEQQTMALQARLMSKALRKLTGKIGKTNTLIIFVNQIREKIGSWGSPEITSGGRALGFYSSVRVEVRKGDWLLKNKQKIGQEIKFRVTKSKICQPWREGLLKYYYDSGFDETAELLSLGLITGKIKRKGGYYNLLERSFHGREELEVALQEDKELVETLQGEM